MAVDLHTHSDVSDGSEPPREVVRLAAQSGLTALALTDHDILSGLGEAKRAAEEFGLELIPGVELSLAWSSIAPSADERGGMHLIVRGRDEPPGRRHDRLPD